MRKGDVHVVQIFFDGEVAKLPFAESVLCAGVFDGSVYHFVADAQLKWISRVFFTYGSVEEDGVVSFAQFGNLPADGVV